MKICSEENCQGVVKARGYCSAHYQKYRYHNVIEEIAPLTEIQCGKCERFFMPSKWNQECCSEVCSQAMKYKKHHRDEVFERRCGWCEAIIDTDRRTDAKFCTEECWNKDRCKRLSDKLWAARSANRKPCFACEKDLAEDKNKNSEYCDVSCKIRGRTLKKYDLTGTDFNRMMLEQNGVCLICETDNWDKGKTAAIDHDHKTGKVRGLLCGNCNQGLGRFKDNPVLLDKAAQYLRNR